VEGHRLSAGARALALAGYAAATFLAFPQPLEALGGGSWEGPWRGPGDGISQGVWDGGLLFAWLAPAALVVGLRGLPPRRAALLGFVAGLAAHAAVLHWIYVVTVTYGHAPPAVGVVAPLGLAAYVALFPAAFGAVAAWLGHRLGALGGVGGVGGGGGAGGVGAPSGLGGLGGLPGPFVLAALWTALDHLRSFFLTGFPWATLGYALHRDAPLLALSAWTGVYGLSFAAVLGGAALAELVRRPLRRPLRRSGRGPAGRPGEGGVGWRPVPRRAWVALAAVGLLHALGAGIRLAEPAAEDAGSGASVRVAVLQGNIDQGVKWSPAWAERTLAIYEDLTRRAADRGAELVVWPETAVPGSPSTDPALRERLAALAREVEASLVVGAVGVDPAPDGASGGRRAGARFYDSAFVFGPDGALRGRYDKAHLVPFGEYVPLRDLLGRFASALARGIAPRDVSPGPGPRVLAVPRPGGEAPVPAGVPICYELLFPDLMRRFVDDGAGVLLAITNDAWYGRTGAPYQFLAITALRSAESGVWTARAANTGVSGFIDARGRVRERTDIFERDLRVADVPLRPPPRGGTFYTRHGDVFAWACWAAVAAAGLAAVATGAGGRRGRRAQGGSPW